MGYRFARARTVVLAVSVTALLVVPGATTAGAAATAGGTAASGLVSANTRLTTDQSILRGHDLPGLAVDPSNPRHMVLIEENFLAGQCDFHTTFDGGQTWTGGVLTVPAGFANPPCNTFDSGGYAHYNQSVVFGTGENVYTTFASHRGLQERPEIKVVQGEGDSIIVEHSTDGGRTFGTGVVAIQGGPGPQPYVIRPGIAVQPEASGDHLVVDGWSVFVTSGGAEGGGGARDLVTSTSDDGGVTWSAPVFADAAGEHIREDAPPVIGPDGTMYVAWRNRDAPSSAPHPVVVAKSSDGGKTWTETPVAQMQPGPKTANNASGFPRLAIDPKSNTLYLVYQNFTALGNVDLYVQHSTDDSATWSAPSQVNDDAPNAAVDHIAGRVSVAPNGRLDVVWLDYRNAYPTPAAFMSSPEGNIYYASSTDSGVTFSANRRITDRSINLDTGLNQRVGSYIWYAASMVELGNNAVEFAWSDSRFGDFDNDNDDIELATLQLDSTGPAAVQPLPSTNASNESVDVSMLAYPAGEERIGSDGASKIVIVNQSDAASALAGSVLARANFGSLLLTPASGLTTALKQEVARLRPSEVFLVGTTATLPSEVEKDLTAAGVKSVKEISGATPEAMAAAVANELNQENPPATASGSTPAAPAAGATAVVVNPASSDAAAASGLAASLDYPVLFVGSNSVPAATTSALQSLNITHVLVVGGTNSVSDTTLNQLPGATRLGGSDAVATSLAAATQAMNGGVPGNVVYVADSNRPQDAAVAGAAAARVGALLVLAPGASATQAQTEISQLHLTTPVDQFVVVKSKTSHSARAIIIVISIILGVLGLILLLAATAMRNRSKEATAAAA